MEKEIWKDIRQYKNYEVSNFGNIRHKKKKKIRIPQDNGNGYKYIRVIKDGRHCNIYIHRIVLESFSPIKNMEQYESNHKNFNRSDNNLNNLEWKNRKENVQYSLFNGRFDNAHKKHSLYMKETIKNGTNPLLNLTEKQRKIRDENWKKNYVKEKHPFYKKYGEQSSAHKLTKKLVLEIRQLYKEKKYVMLDLAKKFNVSYSAINCILHNKSWKNI